MMAAIAHWRLMAAYNAGANKILYDAVARLPDDAYRQ